MSRQFLTRQEATYLLGLMDASQRREPDGVRVACRDRETGEVHEAAESEVLHAQIAIRARLDRPDCGWTIDSSALTELMKEAVVMELKLLGAVR